MHRSSPIDDLLLLFFFLRISVELNTVYHAVHGLCSICILQYNILYCTYFVMQ